MELIRKSLERKHYSGKGSLTWHQARRPKKIREIVEKLPYSVSRDSKLDRSSIRVVAATLCQLCSRHRTTILHHRSLRFVLQGDGHSQYVQDLSKIQVI